MAGSIYINDYNLDSANAKVSGMDNLVKRINASQNLIAILALKCIFRYDTGKILKTNVDTRITLGLVVLSTH